jgi:hypothetical protein
VDGNYSNSVRILAGEIYDELRRIDPNAFIQGDPRKATDTVIDGCFNLLELAALMEKEFFEMPRRKDS